MTRVRYVIGTRSPSGAAGRRAAGRAAAPPSERWTAVLAVCSAFGLIALLWLLATLGPHARYEGRTASEWIAALGSQRRGDRIDAIDALAHLGAESPRAVPAIARALRDRDPDVRVTAVTALGLLGARGRRAVPQLIAVLRYDADETVRAQAAAVLGVLGAGRASVVRALATTGLWDSTAVVRSAAATALGNAGSERRIVIPRLTWLLTDGDPKVRESARAAIAHLRQWRAP